LNKVKYELMQAYAEVQSTTVSTHPLVEKAQEKVKQAWVNLKRVYNKSAGYWNCGPTTRPSGGIGRSKYASFGNCSSRSNVGGWQILEK